ncbi:MAG TPA: integrase [Ktedonobacteraceae bacterium]|nr:integrase [Ktedonobacteraceae bacterium]
MALQASRFEEKQARREAGEHFWSFSSGLIHSHGTRNTYQQHILSFIQWARSSHSIRRLEALDQRADELATAYLNDRLIQGCSPYTMQTERAALRLFFDQRDLASSIELPERRREQITRSRQTVVRDKDFQPANWQPLIRFLQATGLRRTEIKLLQIEDIQQNSDTDILEVVVKKGHGKGGRPRIVPVLLEYKYEVLALKEGRDPQERVFPRIPSHLDIHAIRRMYAQAYYCFLSGRSLPSSVGRLKRADYDEQAVLQVSQALGHNRKDIVLRHYLR